MPSPAQFKMTARFKFRYLLSKISKAKFLIIETIQAYLFPVPKITILFSPNEGFEKNIRHGFKFLNYKISFDDFTPENIKKNRLLVPLNINDVRKLAQTPKLTKDKLIPIPNLNAVNICDNKYLFSTTLLAKGFGDVMPKISSDLPLPFLLKKKTGWAGDNAHLVFNAEQKEKVKDLMNDPDYFCQEVIKGSGEYATHILFKDHKIVTSLSIKYLFFDETFINGKDKFVCTNIV